MDGGPGVILRQRLLYWKERFWVQVEEEFAVFSASRASRGGRALFALVQPDRHQQNLTKTSSSLSSVSGKNC